MEYQKIVNFFDTTPDENSERFPLKDLPRFVTKKWFDVYHRSKKNYSSSKEIRIKTSMLRSDLCDFNDVYIVVKEDNDANKQNKNLAFTKNAPFINCI